jgi:predicted  nucleic acid-binding Zn-ribbon protein
MKKGQGALPAELRAMDERLAKLMAAVQTKSTALSEVEKAQRQSQAALELNRDRQTRSDARLEGVQNSQEFQAATKELEQLKKQKASLEEQMKKSASEAEAIRKELAEMTAQKVKLDEERKAQAAEHTGRMEKLQGEVTLLMGERAKLVPQVESRLLSQYDRVRMARAGLGIVPAIAGRCKGCNMMVPPQQFNELQRGNALHQCPSCHRILFVPEVK